jgi:hypothetical protein
MFCSARTGGQEGKVVIQPEKLPDPRQTRNVEETSNGTRQDRPDDPPHPPPENKSEANTTGSRVWAIPGADGTTLKKSGFS